MSLEKPGLGNAVKALAPNLSLNHSHNFNKLILLPLSISNQLYRPPIA